MFFPRDELNRGIFIYYDFTSKTDNLIKSCPTRIFPVGKTFNREQAQENLIMFLYSIRGFFKLSGWVKEVHSWRWTSLREGRAWPALSGYPGVMCHTPSHESVRCHARIIMLLIYCSLPTFELNICCQLTQVDTFLFTYQLWVKIMGHCYNACIVIDGR